jgi:hypothetical protein
MLLHFLSPELMGSKTAGTEKRNVWSDAKHEFSIFASGHGLQLLYKFTAN